MLAIGATATDWILGAHIVFVIAALGVAVGFPVFERLVERVDRTAMPAVHQARKMLGRVLINPVLLLVLIAGIVLASREHVWKQFFVQWGIAAIVVMGALEGSVVMRYSGKLAEIARRDLPGEWSDEYTTMRSRMQLAATVLAVLVLVTAAIMAIKPGS